MTFPAVSFGVGDPEMEMTDDTPSDPEESMGPSVSKLSPLNLSLLRPNKNASKRGISTL